MRRTVLRNCWIACNAPATLLTFPNRGPTRKARGHERACPRPIAVRRRVYGSRRRRVCGPHPPRCPAVAVGVALIRTIRTISGFSRVRLTECPLCGPALPLAQLVYLLSFGVGFRRRSHGWAATLSPRFPRSAKAVDLIPRCVRQRCGLPYERAVPPGGVCDPSVSWLLVRFNFVFFCN